jgi:hypothetical protein
MASVPVAYDPVRRMPPVVAGLASTPSAFLSGSQLVRGAGVPLAAGVRGRMQRDFGRDFSEVRVHSDPTAADLARVFNAAALTVGHDIVFGRDRYQPDTRVGRRLLAHELAHVVQQRGAGHSSRDGGAAEGDARSAAAAVVEGRAPTIGASTGPVVARQPVDAGVPEDAAPAGHDAQLECVRRLGGCANSRPAGIPSPEEIDTYNESCRGESGYGGPPLTPTDDECTTTVAPAGPPTPTTPHQVCSRDLQDLPVGHHAYVRSGDKQYAVITPLCPVNWWDSVVGTGTGAQKWDNSPDPCGKSPTCIDCLPAPGVTDVGACLNSAFSSYNNPSEYHATGPNSNTFAGTLARRCCAGMVPQPAALGWMPGWDDPPAGSRPTPAGGCPPGPSCR